MIGDQSLTRAREALASLPDPAYAHASSAFAAALGVDPHAPILFHGGPSWILDELQPPAVTGMYRGHPDDWIKAMISGAPTGVPERVYLTDSYLAAVVFAAFRATERQGSAVYLAQPIGEFAEVPQRSHLKASTIVSCARARIVSRWKIPHAWTEPFRLAALDYAIDTIFPLEERQERLVTTLAGMQALASRAGNGRLRGELLDASRWYHGGRPGLVDELLPPTDTEAPTDHSARVVIGPLLGVEPPEQFPNRDYDRVFLTRDAFTAACYAAFASDGDAGLYEAEPVGEIEPDPSWPDELRQQVQCERARIVRSLVIPEPLVAPIRDGLIRGMTGSGFDAEFVAAYDELVRWLTEQGWARGAAPGRVPRPPGPSGRAGAPRARRLLRRRTAAR